VSGCGRGPQFDDGDGTFRLLLVLRVPVLVHGVDDRPATRVVGVVGQGWAGGDAVAVAADLDLALGGGFQVRQPRGRCGRAALGGDDQVGVAVAGVGEGVGARQAGAPAGGAQQQGGVTEEQPVAEESVGVLVDLLVGAQDLMEELAHLRIPSLSCHDRGEEAALRRCARPGSGDETYHGTEAPRAFAATLPSSAHRARSYPRP
jgi:hypothetical protein